MTERVRHACLMCGGSCQGVEVTLMDDAERARVVEQAAALGVLDPLSNGGLRRVGGRCAFLDGKGLCRIHGRWGLAAKPTVCQQFPMVAIRAEDGLRVGVDPACYTAVKTWRDGPVVDDGRLLATRSSLSPSQLATERVILRILEASGTVGGALSSIVEEPCDEGGLPVAFATRWVTALAELEVSDLSGDADTAPLLGAAVRRLGTYPWDAATLPVWGLDADREAWAMEATRRVVWLRLGRPLEHPGAVAVLALGGAVACGWVASSTADFGWLLAGWLRALRSPNVVGRLLPSPARLRWLVGG